MTFSHCSSVTASAVGPEMATPALHTRISIPRISATIAAAAAFTDFESVTSICTPPTA